MIRGDSARVKVEYRVMTDGTALIDDIHFETGATAYHRQYRQSIETWLKSGSYRPEQLDGQPVVTRISVPVEFISDGKSKVSSKSEAIARNSRSAPKMSPSALNVPAFIAPPIVESAHGGRWPAGYGIQSGPR